MCQKIPPIQLLAENPAEPGKLTLQFRIMEESLPDLLGGKVPDAGLDLSPIMEGIFGENFFHFYVLRLPRRLREYRTRLTQYLFPPFCF